MFPYWIELELTLPQLFMAGGAVAMFTQMFLARR
jgi:hypothetical protein